MKNIGPFLIIVHVLVSCHHSDQIKTIRIDEDNSATSLYSDFFDHAKLIKIETKPECLIGNIGKIKVDENKIFCFDPWARLLFIFDNDGKFVAKVGKKGRGPGEYLTISDFLLDKKNKRVEILDQSNKKTLVYDYNGNYLYSQSSFLALGFEKIDSDLYVAYRYNHLIEKDKSTDLRLFTGEGKLVKSFDNFSMIPHGIGINTYSNLFKSSDGYTYIIPTYEYSLFRISQDGNLSHVTEFLFNRTPPKSVFESNPQEMIIDELVEKRYPHLLSNLIADSSYIYLVYTIGHQMNQVFWNIKTNITRSVKKGKWIDDIAHLPGNIFRGAFEGGLIQAVEPVDFLKPFPKGMEIPSDIQDPELRKQIETISNSTEPSDNPILIFYKYKG